PAHSSFRRPGSSRALSALSPPETNFCFASLWIPSVENISAQRRADILRGHFLRRPLVDHEPVAWQRLLRTAPAEIRRRGRDLAQHKLRLALFLEPLPAQILHQPRRQRQP